MTEEEFNETVRSNFQSLVKAAESILGCEEYMAYNTEGAWVGENTPAFLEFAPTDEEKRIEKFVTALIHLTKTAELLEEKTQLLESFMSALTYFLRRCILRLDELDGPHIPGARDALDAAESFLKTK
jgi:hypothetical protein